MATLAACAGDHHVASSLGSAAYLEACTSTSDCMADLSCMYGVCTHDCATSDGCGTTAVCVEASGFCAPPEVAAAINDAGTTHADADVVMGDAGVDAPVDAPTTITGDSGPTLALQACAHGGGTDLRARLLQTHPAESPAVSGAHGDASYFHKNLGLGIVTDDTFTVAASLIVTQNFEAMVDDTTGYAPSITLNAPTLVGVDGANVNLLDDPQDYWGFAGPSYLDNGGEVGELWGLAFGTNGQSARVLNEHYRPWMLNGGRRRLMYSPSATTHTGEIDTSAVRAIARAWAWDVLSDDDEEDIADFPPVMVFDNEDHLHFIGRATPDATEYLDVITSIEPSSGDMPWRAVVVETIAFPGPVSSYSGEANAARSDGARLVANDTYFQFSSSTRAWVAETISTTGNAYVVDLRSAQPSALLRTENVGGTSWTFSLRERSASGTWTTSAISSDFGLRGLNDDVLGDGTQPTMIVNPNGNVAVRTTAGWDILGAFAHPQSPTPAGVTSNVVEVQFERSADGTLYSVQSLEYLDTSGQRVDNQLVLYTCPAGGDCFCNAE